MHDRGAWRDRKGRIVTTLPVPGEDFRYPRDDSLAALEESLESAAEVLPIAELMRHDVDRRLGGSKGRRRRQPSNPKSDKSRVARESSAALGSRIGRPIIGAELRVYVQTSIARRTRELLAERGVSLAHVLDECAHWVVRHER